MSESPAWQDSDSLSQEPTTADDALREGSTDPNPTEEKGEVLDKPREAALETAFLDPIAILLSVSVPEIATEAELDEAIERYRKIAGFDNAAVAAARRACERMEAIFGSDSTIGWAVLFGFYTASIFSYIPSLVTASGLLQRKLFNLLFLLIVGILLALFRRYVSVSAL